ncbi:hypothetical protein NZD89_12990 [Alicyclobacillus fastidiosus]|uniref:Cytosolic protein n=1 Tax=Alicyclobacillus fastidiosus TaxID=392011 RepID=A0ABY6ZMQ1_9BACL|nr:hypothetical protein [Alicyclobacillus fastidiosus]WAH44213.1 hypothetical protein NZD89_12990 [Alicyclobacillus fastidiosus]GMA60530.1 hypothetical protein GCM10025859_09700 [Alicyclobacillus fastidiosus]
MNHDKPQTQVRQSEVVESPNSGSYNPGPIKSGENDFPNAELWEVQSRDYDLAVEEFAEGPYGAAHNETRLGKVSEWKPGQAVTGRFRDANMIHSDRRSATEEDHFEDPPGTLEGQN